MPCRRSLQGGFSLVELCIATLLFIAGSLAAIKLTGVYQHTMLTLDEQLSSASRLALKQAELTRAEFASERSSGSSEVDSEDCLYCPMELNWHYRVWISQDDGQDDWHDPSAGGVELAPTVVQLTELTLSAEWQSHNGSVLANEIQVIRFHPRLDQPDLLYRVNLGPSPTL